MRCPFLREAQVKSCGASDLKKMIVRLPSPSQDETNERCSSVDYVNCPWAKQHREDFPDQSRCPFLEESLAQYCSGSSVVKYIPYSDPVLTRCGTSSHRYCELFLMLSHPNFLTYHEADVPTIDSENRGPWIVDGIPTTSWHYYSRNHMWLEIDEDGICHIGIDPFFAKVVGKIERLAFVTASGTQSSAAVITVNGVDLSMEFPNRLITTAINSHVRAEPNRIVSDPYTSGWLFEGTKDKTSDEHDPRTGLIHGEEARAWMQSETKRLSEFVHEKFIASPDNRLIADGGTFTDGLSNHLSKEQISDLYNEFFFSKS